MVVETRRSSRSRSRTPSCRPLSRRWSSSTDSASASDSEPDPSTEENREEEEEEENEYPPPAAAAAAAATATAMAVAFAEPPPPKRRRLSTARATNPAYTLYDPEHMAYYDTVSPAERARLDAAEAEVARAEAEGASNAWVPMRFRLLGSEASPSVKAVMLERVRPLCDSSRSVPTDAPKLTRWGDAALRLPLGRTRPLPVDGCSPRSAVREFLAEAGRRMDARMHGHREAKDHILRTLAKWVRNPGSRGVVIGLQGPMGCGKTTLAKACVAESLGLPMEMVPLGGVSDAAVLKGHSYTYEGSTYGAVAAALMRAGCMNPVLLFDELDKVGGGSGSGSGRDVENALLHLTDPMQNERFVDNYFAEVPLDLSRAIMVFTFNRAENVCPILLDRMTVIRTEGYGPADKVQIARRHLLPRISQQYGMGEVGMSEDAVRMVIQRVPDEAGVRHLERGLDTIVSHMNVQSLVGDGEGEGDGDPPASAPLDIDCELVKRYLKRTGASSDSVAAAHMYM